MVFAKISHVAHYLPKQILTNHDLAEMMDTTDEWISSRTGIKERRISDGENTSDLASAVAKQLLDKSGYRAEELDFILVATITPDSLMPSTATKVQAHIGAVNAFAFDLTAACSGFVYALAMADKLIRSGAYQKGLVIGSEVFSKVLDWQDRRTAVLFGDGAGGVLLEASDQQHILAESLNADGNRQGLDSGYLGFSSPFTTITEACDLSLKMDGKAIFDFAVRDVSKSIKAFIEASPVTVEDLDYVLLHQANQRLLDKIARKIGVDSAKCPVNLMTYGNTSAASIPILLSECVADGRIRLDGSQTILLSGFGGGLTWASLILHI